MLDDDFEQCCQYGCSGYRGHGGHAEFDFEAEIFHGVASNTGEDVVTFDGAVVQELQRAFQDSIDDYYQMIEKTKIQDDTTTGCTVGAGQALELADLYHSECCHWQTGQSIELPNLPES